MRQVLRAGALGRPRGIGWGTHVNPWLINVSVWQKPLQYYKLISPQLIKINEKKFSKSGMWHVFTSPHFTLVSNR